MKSYILIENMVFHAFHGVLPQENKVGNEFTVTLKITADLTKASISDNLDDTISYADIYLIVEAEMKETAKLLEHLAKRIVDRIKQRFTIIDEIEIKLTKRNPPMRGQVESASIIIIE